MYFNGFYKIVVPSLIGHSIFYSFIYLCFGLQPFLITQRITPIKNRKHYVVQKEENNLMIINRSISGNSLMVY